MYNYYDNMIEEQMFEVNKKQTRRTGKTVEELTNDMVKLFVKENKKTLLKDLTVSYVGYIKDTDKLKVFNDTLSVLKNKFNTFIIDVYYDYREINSDMSEAGYIRYANNKFNTVLKQKFLILNG